MTIPVEAGCQDAGRPGCLTTPDPQYTMSFEDIGEGCIYWCSHCGPEAQAINNALTKRFLENDPKFVEAFKTLVEQAEARSSRRS